MLILVKRFFKLLLLACFFITCSEQKEALPFYNSPDFTPIFEKPKKDSHTINSFVFTNQNNESFGSKDLIGKIHVANFIFTSCTNICPIMTTNMTKVESEFANDEGVELVSITVAFFYTFFVYLMLAPKIKWRFLKLIIVILIITGLRIEFGLFSIVFLLIFITSKYRINRNFKYFIIFILGFTAFYFKVFDSFVDTFIVLKEYYIDYIGSTTTSSNSLFLKLANLPFPFNFLFSFFYSALMPLPIFSLVIFEDDLTLLPSIINPFYWIFVLGVSIFSLFKNLKKYTFLDLLLIASFLCICLSSYVEPNVRRNFAVYPIIFLHYLVVKNNLSIGYRKSIFIFSLLFVISINLFVYSYFIF